MNDSADDFNDAIKNGDFAKAQYLMTQLWLDTTLFITTKTNPELNELNYIKMSIDTGAGTYLLSLLHVDGEKIKLHELL